MHKNTLKGMNNKGKNKTKTFAKEPERGGAGSWPSKTTWLTAGTFSPVQNYQCLHSLGSQAAHVSSLIPGPAQIQ
jgi:hypothetical protein